MNVHSHEAFDAARRFDPTGTTDIRSRFRGEMLRRWQRLKQLAMQAIVGEQDVLGLSRIGSGDAVRQFQGWLDNALARQVTGGDGSWTQHYLDEAAARARSRAYRLVPPEHRSAGSENNHPVVSSIAAVELQGVAEAVSQQAARAVAAGLLAKQRARKIAADVVDRINKVGRTRSIALVEMSVNSAFNGATLDTFKALGLTKVGIQPEHLLPGTKIVGKKTNDALDRNECHDPHTGEFCSEGSGEKFSQPSAEKFIEARNKSKRSQFLSPLKSEDLKDHTLLMNGTGTVGVSVSSDGDVQNVFNNGGPKGAAADAMVQAIDHGGRTLDCYDGYLPGYYRQFGFRETGRMKFNPEFAHDWKEEYGSPDVVFMRWRGYDSSVQSTIQRAQTREDWIVNERSTNYETNWDEAKKRSGAADHSNGRAQLWPSSDGAGAGFIVGTGARARRTISDAPAGTGPGSRISREEPPSASTIARIRTAAAGVAELETVEVLTAGDNDVCPECEDISDSGPYEIDAARSLIPAHPWCRCAFVPYFDSRFGGGDGLSPLGDSRWQQDEQGNWRWRALDENLCHDPHTGEFCSGGETSAAGLSPEEGAALVQYTNYSSDQLNRGLWHGNLTPQQQEEVAKINGALDKLPPYKGEVWRAIDDPGGVIAAKYQKGRTIEELGFTSGSDVQYGGNTVFNIQSRTSRSIEHLSSFPEEREFLFKSGSRFAVTRIEKDRGKSIIYLRDVS